ncbi:MULTISPECIES: hypothetical protein [Vagococcus]|uniref:Uncharacterized protein n=1 Tax=Vagococcus fluvialis bH819 TaxID=1255619 RepID=A0A1X6WPV9_9ENTE|nr:MULTISPECIES: hypothetical protein [Vagococcus]SLM85686.1 hypothetical protein FM121_06275 [Vagococcus fluvialis bH819]HCM90108.1 hypothetical protein [Vagococcus sp.]
MAELTDKPGVLIKKMLDNISLWDETQDIEEATEILNKNTELMEVYQSLPLTNLKEQDKNNLKLLFTELKKLMTYLDNEKVVLFDKMTQLNQSDKIASQYIKQYSESFFIDKDF